MTSADLAHLHLLLNHFPIIGTIIGLGLLLLSLVRKNDHLIKVSFEVFVLIALATLPTYFSGVAAADVIKGRPGVSDAWMEAHQNAALLAFVMMGITGAFAWFGLWQFRRISRPLHWNVVTVLLFSVVTVAVMARAANIGGEIRHPEIRADQETTASEDVSSDWAYSEAIGAFVNSHTSVWPTCETLHFLGMSLLFGVLLVVNLRMLGMMTNVSFSAVHRLLPWGILGFGVNVVTGMLFFTAAPTQYTVNVAFHWKIALLLLAGANFLYLTVADGAWALAPEDRPPLTVKAVAASSIFLWAAVMYCGRMLPFLGNAF